MKVKLFAVLLIATASFQNFEATDLSLLQHFMENELPPQAGYPLEDSLPGEEGTTELPKSLICPREIKVSWQLKPPFTLENYSKEDQPQVNGILHQALKFALERCCAYYRGNKTTMRYLTMSDNSSVLQRTALTEDISLSFPFQRDWYIDSRRRYINIFDSPGIVIIRRVSPTERRAQLLKAILGAWPIIVLSLLMSSLAGICIWMLDGKNEKEFGQPFYRGAFDGFWWAFVTMSTVGYGDKTPKSISGRLFSVLWIMTGITVCSILTATLSSALTNVTVNVERYDVTTGKTIGVPKDSIAFKRAVNLGINITDFQSLHEAYYSLKNGKLEGIMEEMFTAVEFIKSNSNSELSIAQFFEDKHGFGAAIKEDDFDGSVLECLSGLTEFVSADIYSNASTFLKSLPNRHITPPTMKNLEQSDSPKNDYSIFDQESNSFRGTILGISVALFLFIVCSTGFVGVRYLRRKRPKGEVADLEEVEKGL